MIKRIFQDIKWNTHNVQNPACELDWLENIDVTFLEGKTYTDLSKKSPV